MSSSQQTINLLIISCGAVYLNSVSLIALNNLSIKSKDEIKNIKYPYIILNGGVFIGTSIIIVSCYVKTMHLLLK